MIALMMKMMVPTSIHADVYDNDDAAHYEPDADADDDDKCVRLFSQWFGSESIRHTQSPVCKQVVVHSFARGVGEYYSLLFSLPPHSLRHLVVLTQSLAQSKSKAHHYGSLAKQFLCVTRITSPLPLSPPLPFHFTARVGYIECC